MLTLKHATTNHSFLPKDSVRVGVVSESKSMSSDPMECVGFRTPGGKLVLVVLNRHSSWASYSVSTPRGWIDLTSPPHSFRTIITTAPTPKINEPAPAPVPAPAPTLAPKKIEKEPQIDGRLVAEMTAVRNFQWHSICCFSIKAEKLLINLLSCWFKCYLSLYRSTHNCITFTRLQSAL